MALGSDFHPLKVEPLSLGRIRQTLYQLVRDNGFEVFDLGTNIKPDKFIEEIRSNQADILAMSALMTTTAPEQKETIELLKKEGLRDSVIVMVGGSAINHSFAESIGADGYAPTAPEAVELAKKLLSEREER